MKRNLYISFPVLFFVFSAFINATAQQPNAATNSVCRLFADVGNTSSVITYIQKGSPVSVIEKYGDYYFITYDSTGGFVSVEKIDLNSGAVYTDYSNPAGQPADSDISRQDIPPDRLSMLIYKYGEQTGRALYSLKIWKGIDHNMVRDSWGKPISVTREVVGYDVIEEWYYPKARLVFSNDILVDWGPGR